jgi:predicted GIY-YIG superfamily endonuclease
MTTIYVLRLQGGKYYVGKTENPQKRFQEHKDGRGSSWTRLYPPIGIYKLQQNASPFDEDKVTKEMMAKYGIDNVRGGSYVTEELDEVQEEALRRELWAAQDCCTNCGRKGHFVKDCYARTDVSGNRLDDSEDEESEEEVILVKRRFNAPINLNSLHAPVPQMGNPPINLNSLHTPVPKMGNVPIDLNSLPAPTPRPASLFPMLEVPLKDPRGPVDLHGIPVRPSPFPGVVKKVIQKKPEIGWERSTHTVIKKKVEKSSACFRCGREGHYADDCYARTTVRGYYLDSDDD